MANQRQKRWKLSSMWCSLLDIITSEAANFTQVLKLWMRIHSLRTDGSNLSSLSLRIWLAFSDGKIRQALRLVCFFPPGKGVIRVDDLMTYIQLFSVIIYPGYHSYMLWDFECVFSILLHPPRHPHKSYK